MSSWNYHTFLLKFFNVTEQKDLGVILDANLKLDEHASTKIIKVNAMVNLTRRSLSYLDGPLFRKLFVALERPHLEYDKVILAPYLKNYINALENVQRRATKLADGYLILNSTERLKRLNFPCFA